MGFMDYAREAVGATAFGAGAKKRDEAIKNLSKVKKRPKVVAVVKKPVAVVDDNTTDEDLNATAEDIMKNRKGLSLVEKDKLKQKSK